MKQKEDKPKESTNNFHHMSLTKTQTISAIIVLFAVILLSILNKQTNNGLACLNNFITQADLNSDCHTFNETLSKYISKNYLKIIPRPPMPKELIHEFSNIEKVNECKDRLKIFISHRVDRYFRPFFENKECWNAKVIDLNAENIELINTIQTTTHPVIIVIEQPVRVWEQELPFLRKVIEMKKTSKLEIFNFYKSSSIGMMEELENFKFNVIEYGVTTKYFESENPVQDLIKNKLSKYEAQIMERTETKSARINVTDAVSFIKRHDGYKVLTNPIDGNHVYKLELNYDGKSMKLASGDFVKIELRPGSEVKWRLNVFDQWSRFTEVYKIESLIY